MTDPPELWQETIVRPLGAQSLNSRDVRSKPSDIIGYKNAAAKTRSLTKTTTTASVCLDRHTGTINVKERLEEHIEENV